MKCKWSILLIALLLTAVYGTSSVNAAEIPKTKLVTSAGVVNFHGGEAEITILGKQGKSLAGKELEIHQLFTAENAAEKESIQYSLNQDYKKSLQELIGGKLNKKAETVTEYEIIDYMQSLNTHATEGAGAIQELEGSYSEYRYFVEELEAQLKKDQISGSKITVADTTLNNHIILRGLEYGYYMILDVSDTKGTESAVSLCVMTTANPDAYINIKADYPTVIKKIYEDDGAGWNDIADYEIGQAVPYKYESEIPDMNGYHTYYYAWHDKMDDALKLQTDSVTITISGKINSAEKEYQLKRDEFELLLNPEEDVTFQIQIHDMKAIVDREFNQLNANKENVYGQKVVVRYDAVLTEKAAEDTGRPGFENDVRLEFSNNPNASGAGETGYTPWDTVVCFTYRLDGIKINNHNESLGNAGFRLYYDETCVKEVAIRKIDGKYCVIHADSTEKYDGENAKIVSNSAGNFVIYGLDGGTYYLKEVEAPAGYRSILDAIEIQIEPQFPKDRDNYVKGEGGTDQILLLKAVAKTKIFKNGGYEEEESELQTEEQEGAVHIAVINEIGKKLPITGSVWMPLFTVTGILCMTAAFIKGKKKNA